MRPVLVWALLCVGGCVGLEPCLITSNTTTKLSFLPASLSLLTQLSQDQTFDVVVEAEAGRVCVGVHAGQGGCDTFNSNFIRLNSQQGHDRTTIKFFRKCTQLQLEKSDGLSVLQKNISMAGMGKITSVQLLNKDNHEFTVNCHEHRCPFQFMAHKKFEKPSRIYFSNGTRNITILHKTKTPLGPPKPQYNYILTDNSPRFLDINETHIQYGKTWSIRIILPVEVTAEGGVLLLSQSCDPTKNNIGNLKEEAPELPCTASATSTSTTSTSTTTPPPTEEPLPEPPQPLAVFLLILCCASVLVGVVLAVRKTLHYRSSLATVSQLDITQRDIAAKHFQLLQEAGLQLCLVLLLLCLCCQLYCLCLCLALRDASRFMIVSVLVYILGAATFLVNILAATHKIHRLMQPPPARRPRATPLTARRVSRRRTTTGHELSPTPQEDWDSTATESSSVYQHKTCTNRLTSIVLKACLFLLLICLCTHIMSFYLVW